MKRIIQNANTAKDDAAPHPRRDLEGLAGLFVADLAKGGKGEIDLDTANSLRRTDNAVAVVAFDYLLGKYLSLHGQEDKAIEYWRHAMSCTSESLSMRNGIRSLMGAELVKRNVMPDAYKDLMQPEQEGKQPTEAKPE